MTMTTIMTQYARRRDTKYPKFLPLAPREGVLTVPVTVPVTWIGGSLSCATVADGGASGIVVFVAVGMVVETFFTGTFFTRTLSIQILSVWTLSIWTLSVWTPVCLDPVWTLSVWTLTVWTLCV